MYKILKVSWHETYDKGNSIGLWMTYIRGDSSEVYHFKQRPEFSIQIALWRRCYVLGIGGGRFYKNTELLNGAKS